MDQNINTTAEQRFGRLDADRNGILRRAEKFARWTIPKIFPEQGHNQNHQALPHDFQSLGAQATNHLANRLMMTLFAPSRPFFRLEPSKALKQQLANAGANTSEFDNKLAAAEKEASSELDKRSIRARMYTLLKHLIIVGNALMVLTKDNVRVLGLRNYVNKRNADGEVIELVIKEKVHKSALDPKVRALVDNHPQFKPDAQGMCHHYRWVTLKEGSYWETQWVDEIKLPAQFTSKYSKARMPYRAVTWDLASGDDYGSGLVEDFAGDFAALSAMSKATIQAAILASEYRWLVNPTGMTSATDLEESENGAALPGIKGDIELVHAGVEGNLQVNVTIQSTYVNRIGAGFMLQSAVTRDAERVTAVELRMNAEELEGGLGGAYSRIAVDLQVPLAYWTMGLVGKDIIGKDIEPTIITGLAALSRTGDRDRLNSLGASIGRLLSLPSQILDRLNLSVWMDDLASAEGLDRGKYIKSEAQYQQEQQVRMQQALQMQAANAQIEANAQQGAT